MKQLKLRLYVTPTALILTKLLKPPPMAAGSYCRYLGTMVVINDDRRRAEGTTGRLTACLMTVLSRYDRTGDHKSRVKMSQDLAAAINDGLYDYEDELWDQSDTDQWVRV